LWDAIVDRLMLLAGRPDIAERRELLAELEVLPRATGLYSLMSSDVPGGLIALSEGDRPVFEAHLERQRQQAARQHSVWRNGQCRQWEATLALLDGRFDEVDALSELQLTATAEDANFLLSYFGQLAAHRVQTGRGEEFLPMVDAAIAEHPNLPILQALKARVCVGIGRMDTARAIVDELAPAGFARVQRGVMWPTCLAELTESVAALGAVDHARTLLPLVEPWSGQCLVVGLGLDVVGAADRYIGMLELVLGRYDGVDDRFGAAIALESRLESPPLVARTRYWWGRSLLARRQADDVERAVDLLAQCRQTAEQLGMPLLARQASAGIGTV
jgi:hypothetical protein